MTDIEKLIYDSTESDFNEKVVERSKNLPVLVDFWAEWCAPCRILSPVLEELVREYEGKIVLAKVDVDQNQYLAVEYGVQSIPAVKIFLDGRIADEFVGALPPEQIKEKIDAVLPGEKSSQLEEADRLLAGGRWEEAQKIYSKILASKPDQPSANLGMGMIAYHQGRYDDTEKYLNFVTDDTPGYEKVPPMLARIYFSKIEVLGLDEITAALKDNPDDCRALYSLAVIYARGGEYERALDGLLHIIRVDKSYEDGIARKTFLKIMDIIGRSSSEGRKYERELSMALFS